MGARRKINPSSRRTIVGRLEACLSLICETSDIFRLTLPFVRVLVNNSGRSETGYEGRESYYSRDTFQLHVIPFTRKFVE